MNNFSEIQKNFIEFLQRPDDKQEKLDEFVDLFNSFSDEWIDLREDEQTKDEFHARVDTLADNLWDIISERKEDSIEEREKIKTSGWIEHELEVLTLASQRLMQNEVDKFRGLVQLLQDYYYAIEEKLIPEPPPAYTVDLITADDELPPIEAEGEPDSFPRLDKLYERSIKAQILPEVVTGGAGAAAKGGAPPPKGGKAPEAKKEEENNEPTIYQKELKDGINNEKAVLRYRLTLIRNWAIKRLKELRARSNQVYEKLDDWILVAEKAEQDAVVEMENVIKDAIETETKLQHELRIRYMDFFMDEKILNFLDPPPEILEAKEDVREERFNIAQLTSFTNDLMSNTLEGSDLIDNATLIDILIRKTVNLYLLSFRKMLVPLMMLMEFQLSGKTSLSPNSKKLPPILIPNSLDSQTGEFLLHMSVFSSVQFQVPMI
jgi:hypothetical protein